MASFFRATVREFLALTDYQILATLNVAYAHRGFTSQYSDQILTWDRDLRSLRQALETCTARHDSAESWGLLLEFSIPRKESRIDLVLLIGDVIVPLEAKSGKAASQAFRQVEEYALLLHYFHKGSNQRRIAPILISTDAKSPVPVAPHWSGELTVQPKFWIADLIQASWNQLPEILLAIPGKPHSQLCPEAWDTSPYFPVPTIIEAALSLRSGLSIREIAHSEASEHEIAEVQRAIQNFLGSARNEKHHAICFLTGVPGSGKTLVGLSLAHSAENKANAIHFMSGNGPLVKVLQHLFVRESMCKGSPATQARAEARTLIENVHVFARYHTEDNCAAPSNHAIIFDEAQRTWNRTQNFKKFDRDYSEPEMLLRIMERHADWALVVALVGGGQEINDGEAGLEEWGRALSCSQKPWVIYGSPEVLSGGPSTAGHKLFPNAPTCAADDMESNSLQVQTSSMLHLRTSNRSLRAEQLATWVNLLLDGKPQEAAALKLSEKYPLFLSRNLNQTRQKLRAEAIGPSRFGLAGSSGAARLRAEGLEPSSAFHADYPWEHWYLAPKTDIRSSFQCEVFATEFEIQGLELDWVGLCWGGDFIWNGSHAWQPRALRHAAQTKWTSIKNSEKQTYRRNAYRVLLTRARQGMVIFVPRGSEGDPTNSSRDFDTTADFLLRCGVLLIEPDFPESGANHVP